MPSQSAIGAYSILPRFVAWGFATSAAVLFLGWAGACGSKTGISQQKADAQAVDAPAASGGTAGAGSDAAAAGSGGSSAGGIVGSGAVTATSGITPTGGTNGTGGATPTGASTALGGTQSSTGGTGAIACTGSVCPPLDAGCTGNWCSTDAGAGENDMDASESSDDVPVQADGSDASSALYDACVLSCLQEKATALYVSPDDAGHVSCAESDGASCSTYCTYETCTIVADYPCSRRNDPLLLSCPETLLAFYVCAASGAWTCVETSPGIYSSQPPSGCQIPTGCPLRR